MHFRHPVFRGRFRGPVGSLTFLVVRSARAAHYDPEEPAGRNNHAIDRGAGFAFSDGLTAPDCVTRLKKVRFRCGSYLRLRKAPHARLPGRTLAGLHVSWSFYMADSFHSARTTRLSVTHQSRGEEK